MTLPLNVTAGGYGLPSCGEALCLGLLRHRLVNMGKMRCMCIKTHSFTHMLLDLNCSPFSSVCLI